MIDMKCTIKCPICGNNLETALMNSKILGCPSCRNIGSEQLWQELIRAKKQVDIAYAGLLGIPEADNSYIKDVTAEDTVEEMRKVK